MFYHLKEEHILKGRNDKIKEVIIPRDHKVEVLVPTLKVRFKFLKNKLGESKYLSNIKCDIIDFDDIKSDIIKEGGYSANNIEEKIRKTKSLILSDSLLGTYICGDAIITLATLGYDLTKKAEIKKAKEDHYSDVIDQYFFLLNNDPDIFGEDV